MDVASTYEVVVVARDPRPATAPTFQLVDPVAWRSIEWSEELSVAQKLTVQCRGASLLDSVRQRLADPTWASELWVYRGGDLVFAGPLMGVQTDDTGDGITVTAHGLLSYLDRWIIDSDQTFTGVDQFTIVKTLVDQWQALEFGHFGIDTGGVGTSGVVRNAKYLRSELHRVGRKVDELAQGVNGFDVEVEPESRALRLWYPQKGMDKSTGEGAVVFDGRNVTSAGAVISAGPDDLASDGYGTGTSSGTADQTLFSTLANTDLRARYGRTAVTGTWDSINEQAVLDAHVQGLIDARRDGLVVPGPDARNAPDADLGSYAVGDTVSYQVSQVLPISGAFRIRKRTVRVASSGEETISLEFT